MFAHSRCMRRSSLSRGSSACGTASVGCPSQITISLHRSHWRHRSRCGICRQIAATSAIMARSYAASTAARRLGDHDRADHGKRGWQAHLKPNALRYFALVACSDEVEIRGAGLAGISEFAKTHLGRRHAFGQREKREAIGGTDGAGRIRAQKYAGTEQRILPADPEPAPADFAVGNAAQVRAQKASDGAHDVVSRYRGRYCRPGGLSSWCLSTRS